MDPKKRIESLKQIIREHDYRYYVIAQPAVSDEEYDALMRELEELESKYPSLKTPDSPTMRIGSDLTKEFPTRAHSSPMLSISNTYNEEEVGEFERRVHALLPGEKISYTCELKIDGVALALFYENGVLRSGVTRGDGMTGEEITQNIRTIRSIPLRVMGYDGNCEVRGEVYLERGDFEEMNREREMAGEKVFANPRNAAAGSLKLQDSRLVAKRPLKFLAYWLSLSTGTPPSQWESLKRLRNLGFPVNPHRRQCSNTREIMKFADDMEKMRNDLPYDIDGIVVKVDSHTHFARLGVTAKSPRGAVAFKFQARQAETILENIIVQVGRTGTVTPVAVLKPVFLAGSTISRATLHNEQEIARKDIRIGDTVIIEKGGDVIPKVVAVVLGKRLPNSRPFAIQDDCPVCSSPLVRDEQEVAIRCVNAGCPAQVEGRILHFASREAMNIQGLGPALVTNLVKSGIVSSYADLYSLDKAALASLERMGKKSAENIITAIEESKKRRLSRLIFALGIRHVGAGVARTLTGHFLSLDALMNADRDTLESIEDIGPVVAESIDNFFRNSSNREIIEWLRKHGLPFKEMDKKISGTDEFFLGKVFVLTGALSGMSRNEASDMIRSRGGKVTSSVSVKTDYVIAGSDPGSKYEDAQKLHISILTEGEFLKHVGKVKL